MAKLVTAAAMAAILSGCYIGKAVKYKNPKTGQFAERAVISTKECGSNDLYDFAAAKALIETTGNSRVILSDWLKFRNHS